MNLRAIAILVASAALLLSAPSALGASSVTVRSGDTLSGIAAAHKVSPSALARHNGIAKRSPIRIGQVLRIPRAWTTYRVRPGESLGGIAADRGTSVVALTRRNGIADPSLLRVGQRILVPVPRTGASAAGGTKKAVTPKKTKPRVPAGWVGYRVRPGESLGQIAVRRKTTSSALARANAIRNPSQIRSGTVIRVPRLTKKSSRPAWIR